MSSNERLAVVVADSTPFGCELLVSALKRCQRRYHLQVVGSATTVPETLELVSRLKPAVAVISAHLHDGHLSGFRTLRELHAAQSSTRVIVLLDEPDRELIVDAFRGGARGIFYRDHSVNDLARCIARVHTGQVWASAGELEFVLDALARSFPLRVVDTRGRTILSKREEEVVRLVAEGMKNREISRQLNLSEHTIRNYLFRIFEKLGISSRVELVLYAMNHRAPESQLTLDGF